jgi:hypothetical protein
MCTETTTLHYCNHHTTTTIRCAVIQDGGLDITSCPLLARDTVVENKICAQCVSVMMASRRVEEERVARAKKEGRWWGRR